MRPPNFSKIEILATEEHGITVIVDDKFADHLCRDEALGVVAAKLMGSEFIPYLQTFEQWHKWQLRHRCSEFVEPVAELADLRVMSRANTRLWPKQFLYLELKKA